MRLGIFPLWTGSEIGGIATYDTELPPLLAEAAPEHEFHVFSPSREAVRWLDRGLPNVVHHQLFPRSRWINVPLSFPIAAAMARLDLTHMTHVPPPIAPRPHVMTFHCFSTFAHPEFYPRGLGLRINSLVRRGMRSSRLVVCVSEGLRDIAESEFGLPRDRLAVAYNGISPRFRPMDRDAARAEVRAAFGLERPYLLFVGVLGPRKNVARVVDAWDLYRERTGAEVDLVIAGRRWIADDVDARVASARHGRDVRFLHHLPQDALPALYAAAEMLVFPSLWESFGIPVVEAMACGTPVVTSRGSCLPEIAGDAAVLVDPRSVESIAEGIASIAGDAALAATLRERGIARAQRFTWKATAQQTLAAYDQAIALGR